MKVSIKWIERINQIYGCSANPAPKGVDDLVERIGRQLGAVEEVIDIGKKYEGIVIAKIVACAKHPNADKLSVCLVDDAKVTKKVKRNKDGLVEVVCGAPNVAKGQLVAWIPPGATVPATYDKDPFVLEAKELRGVVSNGMIASLKELAIGDNHRGILVIDQPAKPGQSFADVYALNDYIIDIENKMFTHRPDLFGMLGLAREIAGIQGQAFKSPDFYVENASLPKSRGQGLKLTVKNESPKQVPRFCALVIRDVKVGPSPVWLQSFLSRVGIRPINNVVDMTNFYMYATAQPLHAYDYDKVGDKIIVRKPKAGESIKLLGGKTVKFNPGDIVIASAKEAIGLGGVMGGADSEVTESTTNIILECANFDMAAIRRSSMAHGLFTDAVTRFNKGQSPRQNMAVISQVVMTITHPTIAGGRLASSLIDVKNFSAKPAKVSLSIDFLNARLGLKLPAPEIKKLLSNVEFKVQVGGNKLVVEAPFWRTDIEIPEDIVEEVGRLYGFDHLPMELPIRDLTPAEPSSELEFQRRIREILSAAGANEVQTYSFVNESLLRKAGQDPAKSYHIRNALSPDLQYYRLNLMPGLLDKVRPNLKEGFDKFVLFEMGKGYLKGKVNKDTLPSELDWTSMVVAGKYEGAGYFIAKKYTDYLLGELGISSYKYVPVDAAYEPEIVTYSNPQRSANIVVGNEIIGRIGEFKPEVRAAFKLPELCAGVDLNTNVLRRLAETKEAYQPLNRFPSLEQDLTLRAVAKTSYAELAGFIEDHLSAEAGKHGISVTIQPLDIFQKAGRADKQTTWRLTFQHPERTLTTQEINKLMDELAASAKSSLKADRI